MPFEHPKLFYPGAGQYIVDKPATYTGEHQTIVVPQGFPTDLATVPRIFWWMIPPQGTYEAAAVLHDYLCTQLNRWDQWQKHPEEFEHCTPPPPPVNAVDTDGLFRRVMAEGGTPWLIRWVMWAGVRWGALKNPARRAGWFKGGAPWLVMLITLIELAVVVGSFLGLHRLASLLLGW